MTRIILLLMLCATMVVCDAGSLTTPDGDDIDRTAILISPQAFDALASYAMNRYAIEWLQRKPDSDTVARIFCNHPDVDGNVRRVEITEWSVTVKRALDCLRTIEDASYYRCVAGAAAEAANLLEISPPTDIGDKYGDLTNCVAQVSPGYRAHEVDDRLTDIDSWGKREIVIMLIGMSADELKRNPALMAALGLVVIGGVIVALPTSPFLVLCPKAVGFTCPDDPGAPGVPQPPPQGDR